MKKIIVVVLVVGAGIYLIANLRNNSSELIDTNNQNALNESEQIDDNVGIEISTVSENKLVGTYEEYSPDIVSQNENKKIVLFFKASWCPSCRVLDTNIKNNLLDIPENVLILEVNYDKAKDLRREYGVTTQHSLVQIDSEGNLIKKWTGGNRLENVLNEIK